MEGTVVRCPSCGQANRIPAGFGREGCSLWEMQD